ARFQNMDTRGFTPNESASAILLRKAMARQEATARQNQMPNKGTRPLAMDAAEGSIVVSAPVAAVYTRWLAFEDYPNFIRVIKRVRKLDKNHFSASLAFNGK